MWIHTSLVGSFFFIFHLMVIVMQSVMVEKVFYGVPHKLGWFEHKHSGSMMQKTAKRIENQKEKEDQECEDENADAATVKKEGEEG